MVTSSVRRQTTRGTGRCHLLLLWLCVGLVEGILVVECAPWTALVYGAVSDSIQKYMDVRKNRIQL